MLTASEIKGNNVWRRLFWLLLVSCHATANACAALLESSVGDEPAVGAGAATIEVAADESVVGAGAATIDAAVDESAVGAGAATIDVAVSGSNISSSLSLSSLEEDGS